MEKNSPVIGIIISVFIAILLGVVMLSISADQVNDITGLVSNTDSAAVMTFVAAGTINEVTEYTVTNAPTGWKVQSASDGGCALTNFVLSNASGTALTLTTDYIVDLQYGTYTMVNTTATADLGATNTTIASYTNCPDGYQTSFGGTVLNMVPGFFALAILVSVAFLIFWILRREGIDL